MGDHLETRMVMGHRQTQYLQVVIAWESLLLFKTVYLELMKVSRNTNFNTYFVIYFRADGLNSKKVLLSALNPYIMLSKYMSSDCTYPFAVCFFVDSGVIV